MMVYNVGSRLLKALNRQTNSELLWNNIALNCNGLTFHCCR